MYTLIINGNKHAFIFFFKISKIYLTIVNNLSIMELITKIGKVLNREDDE